MSVENYDNRVVHLCMRQLFFWKSLTNTGKGVHKYVNSFIYLMADKFLHLLLELTEEIFQ